MKSASVVGGPCDPPVAISIASRIGPPASEVEAWIHEIFKKTRKKKARISVLLCGDRRMRQLNYQYRKIDRPTDVLSFPSGDAGFLGDLAIDCAYAQRQALKHGHELERELKILLVHGILHLMGHDHESDDGTMFRLQKEIVMRAFGRGPDGVPEEP